MTECKKCGNYFDCMRKHGSGLPYSAGHGVFMPGHFGGPSEFVCHKFRPADDNRPMTPEAKSLRWLANMFPYTTSPKDETDRLCNAIHVYTTRGADKIDLLTFGRSEPKGGTDKDEIKAAWFKRMLEANTQEEADAILTDDAILADARRFCPKGYEKKPEKCKKTCAVCVNDWLMGWETPEPDADPAPDVLMFIGRFSTDGHRDREQVIEAFTMGCCFWFARILEERFRDQYGAHIVVDYVANHFATRIAGGRVYDITGDVTEGHTWEPWAACSDPALRRRITEDCIMF